MFTHSINNGTHTHSHVMQRSKKTFLIINSHLKTHKSSETDTTTVITGFPVFQRLLGDTISPHTHAHTQTHIKPNQISREH